MEIKNLNQLVFQIINLPVAYYNTNYSWIKLLRQTGYFEIDNELVTIDLIKKNINSNAEILDGWIYFSENKPVDNSNFIWFNNHKNDFEIRRYDSKERNYVTVKRNLDKETCCAYYIKKEIEQVKQKYYEKIKLEKERFYGVVKLQKNENIWSVKAEQKHHDSSYYPLAKLYVSFNRIELKTMRNKMLISINKNQNESIFLVERSIMFIFNGKNNSSFNSITYFNIFKTKKLFNTLRKFKWIRR